MYSRRYFLRLLGATLFGTLGLGSYAVAYEPRFRLAVTRYRLRPPRWPSIMKPLRAAVITDIHPCEPWMPIARINEIVDTANDLKPDIILMLGDYVGGLEKFRTAIVPMREWGPVLGRLKAPLGTYAILGNHDWWINAGAVRATLRENGIPVLENEARLIEADGGLKFWLAGLGDQLAYRYRGVDDLPKTLAQITDDATPAILMAHEPDIFPRVSDRFSLTLSGHTHGGQVKLPLLGRPIVPSRYGQRYAYGHVVENDRHLIVSSGLGMSNLPVRFGVPPEVVLLELG
ncbi:MAG TPA: metallophosphoesterase [Xanthobacteraceae bacterium]|nr:metallophosphoesterase [Xanthobacteraceae bacterium]